DYKYENYISSKFRITAQQTEDDYLIYDGDDAAIAAWLDKNQIKAKKFPFSLTRPIEHGAYTIDKTMKLNITEEFTMDTSHLALEGKHNIKNAMAASSVAQLLNIRKATIRESMSAFQGVEHRLEKVLKIQNVQY